MQMASLPRTRTVQCGLRNLGRKLGEGHSRIVESLFSDNQVKSTNLLHR